MAERGSTFNSSVGHGIGSAQGQSVPIQDRGDYSAETVVAREGYGALFAHPDTAVFAGPRDSNMPFAVAAYPFAFTLPTPTGGGGGGGPILSLIYTMRGRDVDSTSLTYRYWESTGSADMTGASYTGPKSGGSALADIVIYSTRYS